MPQAEPVDALDGELHRAAIRGRAGAVTPKKSSSVEVVDELSVEPLEPMWRARARALCAVNSATVALHVRWHKKHRMQ